MFSLSPETQMLAMTNTPAPPSVAETWLSRSIVALILIACALMMSQRMVDPDLWGHIQYGEDWLAEGALPRVASHTYAAPDYPWVNHENLSELALAFGHRAVGGVGLMIGKAVFGVLMLLSMIWIAVRKGVHPVLAAASMIAVSMGLIEFWCARPQLASFLCMAAVLLILELAFVDWEENRRVRFGRMLWLIPALIIWTNAHGGFVAGVCVVSAYLGLRGLEVLWRNGKQAVPLAAKLGGAIFVCGLCTLANPYGLDLLMWLLKSLGDPRPEINEWVSIPDSGPTIIPFTALTFLTLVSLKFSNKQRDPAQFITIGLVAVQTFMHCRHIAFYAILFGYWMPTHLQSVWERVKSSVPDKPEPKPLTTNAAWTLGLSFGAVGLLLGGMLAYDFARFGVDREEYPVDALQFMAKNDLDGRIVVTFNWAQYTLAAMPNSTVGFDGRFRTCYPQTVVDMNFDLIIGDHPEARHRGDDSGPFDPTKVLDHNNPDFVLIDRDRDRSAVEVMVRQRDWTLLYQDQMSQLWARKSKYGNADSPHYVADRDVSDRDITGIAAWPGFPRPAGRDAFVVSAREYLATQGKEVKTAAIGFSLVPRIAFAFRSPALPALRMQ